MPKDKKYDLEERTANFAEEVRRFVKKLPKTLGNYEDAKQLIRSSGSVGANYIEANEALSEKDFFYRCKLCRKEAKESGLFLRLIDTGENNIVEMERKKLMQESQELKLIFNKIIGSK